MTATSRIEIDLSAVERNVARIRRALASGSPGRQVGLCAVLKADAYGLGAPRIAKRLEIAAVDLFAVYTPDQARALIEAAIRTPILILMPTYGLSRVDTLYRAASTGRLHFTVHERDQLQSLASLADQLGITLPLHFEVDSGLHRGGSMPDEAAKLVEIAAKHPRLRVAGLCTHFASADCDPEHVARQIAVFDNWLAAVESFAGPDCVVHVANSCATFRSGAHHRDMVRIGLALYGCVAERFRDPESCELIDECRDLEPAIRWTSQVAHLMDVEPGEPVGYGGTWRTDRPTRLALIPVGFADGYPLGLSNRGAVGVELPNGSLSYCPVAGRVSMDQITIDVTDVPRDEIAIGSRVELIGRDPTSPTHLPTLARAAMSSAHDMLSRLGARVPRVYRAAAEQSEPVAVASTMAR